MIYFSRTIRSLGEPLSASSLETWKPQTRHFPFLTAPRVRLLEFNDAQLDASLLTSRKSTTPYLEDGGTEKELNIK